MDLNKLSSNNSEFSDLEEKHSIFRDDFHMAMVSEYRKLYGKIRSIERRYEDERFLKDKLVDIKYKRDLCENQIGMLQIDLFNCMMILNELKDVKVLYGNNEINIYYVDYQKNIHANFIEVHRDNCKKFINMVNAEPRENCNSNKNFFSIPRNNPLAYINLLHKLYDADLIMDGAKDYCGHCLSHVDIDLATADFGRLQLYLNTEIDLFNKMLETITTEKLQIEEDIKEKLDALSKQSFRNEIPENQLKVALEYKKYTLGRFTTFKSIPNFGGFQRVDGKLFVGTGYQKNMGEDLCTEYSNWILIDTNGSLVDKSGMTAEELLWCSRTYLDGPGGGHPIGI